MTAETQVRIDIAIRRGYLDQARATVLDQQYEPILGKLVATIFCPDQWSKRLVHEEGADYV